MLSMKKSWRGKKKNDEIKILKILFFARLNGLEIL